MARALTETFEGAHFFRFGNQLGLNGSASILQYTGFPVYTTQMDGLRSLVLGSGDTRLTMALPAQPEYFIGFFFIATFPSEDYSGIGGSGITGNHRLLIATEAGNPTCEVKIDPSDQKFRLVIWPGETQVAASTQTQVITAGTLYHVQVRVKLDGASSIVQVKLDDVLVIDWTGALAVTNIDQLQWCGPGRSFADSSLNGYHFYDAICINDTVADTCGDTSWPGVLRFKVQQITGPGFYSQFNPTPNPLNWQNVQDLPNDGDLTTNYTINTGDKDSFPVSPNALAASQVTYKAWFQEVIARKNSGTMQIKLGVRRAGTDYMEPTGHDLGVSYDCYDSRRCVDPSTLVSWTSAGLDATEIIYQSA